MKSFSLVRCTELRGQHFNLHGQVEDFKLKDR